MLTILSLIKPSHSNMKICLSTYLLLKTANRVKF